MGIIYINSTLPASKDLYADHEFSPIHYWGYKPSSEDRVHYHRSNRIEIVVRSHLKGLDISIVAQVVKDIVLGFHTIYLVTQPDLITAVPWLRKLFPRCRIITWAWTAEEVRRWSRPLSSCSHVLCMTQPALDAMKVSMNTPCSLQIWGADPGFYRFSEQEQLYDVILLGLTDRDTALASEAIKNSNWRYCIARKTSERMGLIAAPRVDVVDLNTARRLVETLHKARVAWIPLMPLDTRPTGYTNLIEALLCGVAVVIADSSTIPRQVLSLTGVYLYKVRCLNSLLEATAKAVADTRDDGFRARIRASAATHLNGEPLGAILGALVLN